MAKARTRNTYDPAIGIRLAIERELSGRHGPVKHSADSDANRIKRIRLLIAEARKAGPVRGTKKREKLAWLIRTTKADRKAGGFF
jgi:hypothetical protein